MFAVVSNFIASSEEQHLYESGFGIRIPDPDPGVRK
jgi:hypothetical protein